MNNNNLLIKPRSINVDTPKTRTRGIRDFSRSISPVSNSVNFWSSLQGLHSKYEWMANVFEEISNSIPVEKLSYDVIRYVELCLEKFADNFLSQIQVDGFDGDNFGNEILSIWFDFSIEDIENDNDLSEIRDILQECFNEEIENIIEDNSDVSGLFINISSNLIIKFLTKSVYNMSLNVEKAEELTLFFLIWTAEYDALFSIFRLEEYLQPNIIPEKPSNEGLTIGLLQLNLADFIRTNYNVQPSIEPGTIELLAGTSNIIVLNEKTEKIVEEKIKNVTPAYSADSTIFLNCHRYIVYLIFREVQEILQTRNNKQWTNSVVLDAINTVVKKFHNEFF